MNREKYELLDRERRLKYAAKEGSFWLVASVVSCVLFTVACLREYSHERVLLRALNGTLTVGGVVDEGNYTDSGAQSPSQAMREQMQAALAIVNEEKRTLSAELGRLVMELDSTKSSLAAVEEGSKEALSLKAKITEQQRTFSKDLSKIQSLALAQKVSEEKARIKVSKLAADADRYKSKLAAHRLQSAAYNKRLKDVGVKVKPGGQLEVVAVNKFRKVSKPKGSGGGSFPRGGSGGGVDDKKPKSPPPSAMQTITRRRRVPIKTGRRLLSALAAAGA